MVETVVDMYCQYPAATLKFVSPSLKRGRYTLTVTVMGEWGNWSDKRRSDYGSTGYVVALQKVLVDDRQDPVWDRSEPPNLHR